ncbi:iron complex transport system permease protein [Butyrivibrio sp. ob235]|uniref:FecCD family ABC transporter permease n=1 Tax=Butyrivibrio sp. ob235 TaxID=1761780 RepID=UPI0008C54A51|nr:iron ABC transporter permease [Butyrivibrio sp. ob235]SEK23328.1 iron complex transport system permease protein [Butyrivibrio sp. ob235]
MHKRTSSRIAAVFVILFILVLAAFLVNLCVGNVHVDLRTIAQIIFTGSGDEKSKNIIMDIRLPRALMTMILGGGLAVSGFLLQTYFSNPIAGPYILGISSGAKMTVALFLIFIVGNTGKTSSLLLVIAAFAGALIATGFIILISRNVKNMASLLAAGIMIGYICSAITDFLIAFADDSDIVNLHSWSQGSFSGANMNGAIYCLVIVGISMFFVMLLSKSLDAFRLGENYARSVGVNVRLCRVVIILLSSILSACVTAFAGPVSFIGIAVPFLMRESLKSSKPIVLIPASFLSGSIFCLLSDLLARRIFAPTELNISAVTSLFGAPIVIFMIIRRHRNHEN